MSNQPILPGHIFMGFTGTPCSVCGESEPEHLAPTQATPQPKGNFQPFREIVSNRAVAENERLRNALLEAYKEMAEIYKGYNGLLIAWMEKKA